MEFKGTKGKWEIKKKMFEIKVFSDKFRIAEVKHYDIQIDKVLLEPTIEEANANALLISKAPEMLELLELLHSKIDFSWEAWGSDAGYELASEIEQLIKEATGL